MTCILKSEKKLLIHSETSLVQPLEFWEWISNFTAHFNRCVITYPSWDQNCSILGEWPCRIKNWLLYDEQNSRQMLLGQKQQLSQKWTLTIQHGFVRHSWNTNCLLRLFELAKSSGRSLRKVTNSVCFKICMLIAFILFCYITGC